MPTSYLLTPSTSHCPVCAGYQAVLLWRTDSARSAQHFVLREADAKRADALAAHIRTLWGGDVCDIVRCSGCGFCYANPYVAGNATFYRLAFSGTGYPPTWKWEFDMTRASLESVVDNKHRLLEVGAGDGAFVRHIAPALIAPSNILCTEYSQSGRARITAAGITCVAEDVRSLPQEENGRFDSICMFQVLEHCDRLDELFGRLHALLRPGGHLFLAVPNPARIEFNELNGALADMPPNHIGRWNPGCFATIGSRHGLRVLRSEIEPESRLAGAKEFAFYRFLQDGQKSGSLANRICRIGNPFLRRIMKMAGVAWYALTSLPALLRRPSGLGMSLWVHLQRQD